MIQNIKAYKHNSNFFIKLWINIDNKIIFNGQISIVADVAHYYDCKQEDCDTRLPCILAICKIKHKMKSNTNAV